MDAAMNNPLRQSEPLRVWSSQETADLVDFLYKYRGQISQGIIPDKVFREAACHLGRKPSLRRRSKKAIQTRVRNLSQAIATLDQYHAKYGGTADPSFVPDALQSSFNEFLRSQKTTNEVRRLLKAHSNSLFPNYSKLKQISAHIEWTVRGTGRAVPFQSEDDQCSVDPVPRSAQWPDSAPYAPSTFPSKLSGLGITSKSSVQPPSTRSSSPPPVPQSATMYFVPSCFEQYRPESFRSAPLSLNFSSAPMANRQAVQQSVHNPGPERPTPAPTRSFLALEQSDTIQQLSGTTQPESATSPFFSSSHAPSTSPSASENSEADDFIHHWIRRIGSELDPNASPRSPVDCRLEDEAAISDNDHPDQIHDHGNPDQSRRVDSQASEELHVVKAMHSLSGSSAFSDDQKARLLVYLCDYPVVAAAVPDEASSREAFYQDLLEQLDSE